MTEDHEEYKIVEKIVLEVAEAEFERFAGSWNLDTDIETMSIEDRDDFEGHKRKIVRQIQGGRVVINEEGNIIYTLFTPVGTLAEVTIKRPKGRTYMAMDKIKEGQNIGKLLHFLSSAINQLPGVIKQMDGIDFKFLQAVYMLFLGS
jgi:hypothetical protein